VLCPRWLALLLLVLVPAIGNTQPIQADRPGQATPAYVVPKGTPQIEVGGTFARETSNGHTLIWDAPEPLLRYGVLERVELRLSADGWIGSHERGQETQNAGDRPSEYAGARATTDRHRLRGARAPIR